MDKIESPRMWTIRQTARAGVLPEFTLRTLVKNGTIPHIKVGNRVYINVDKLIEILETL